MNENEKIMQEIISYVFVFSHFVLFAVSCGQSQESTLGGQLQDAPGNPRANQHHSATYGQFGSDFSEEGSGEN